MDIQQIHNMVLASRLGDAIEQILKTGNAKFKKKALAIQAKFQQIIKAENTGHMWQGKVVEEKEKIASEILQIIS
jgi:hypothetical protein